MKMSLGLFPLLLFFSGCGFLFPGTEPDTPMTQKVEITNNSSSHVRIDTHYSSDYSSSACSDVSWIKQSLAPGESVSKELKTECRDTWTVGFSVYFYDENDDVISFWKIQYDKEMCDGSDLVGPSEGIAHFECTDAGCEYSCVEI